MVDLGRQNRGRQLLNSFLVRRLSRKAPNIVALYLILNPFCYPKNWVWGITVFVMHTGVAELLRQPGSQLFNVCSHGWFLFLLELTLNAGQRPIITIIPKDDIKVEWRLPNIQYEFITRLGFLCSLFWRQCVVAIYKAGINNVTKVGRRREGKSNRGKKALLLSIIYLLLHFYPAFATKVAADEAEEQYNWKWNAVFSCV